MCDTLPRTPLAGLGLRPSFGRMYASWMVPRNIPGTDISSEHSLRTCTQVRRNVRKSDVVYACKKKKKTRPKWPCVWHLTLRLYAAEPSSHGGPPMLSPFVLAKGTISQVRRSFFCSCERSEFLRVGLAHDRFEWKSMRIALFELASATARFPTRSSATPVQVPRLVQRQNSGRRTRGRTLSSGRAADWLRVEIARPRGQKFTAQKSPAAGKFCAVNFKTTQPCQEIATRHFLKGSFLAKGLLFLISHRRTKTNI